jgi:hypothetical protein
MKTGTRFFTSVAMIASTAQIAAAATVQLAAAAKIAAQPCITPAEVRAGMAFLAPTMIRGVREKCAAVLPRNAYLNRQGEQLVNRFAVVKDPAALQSLIGKVSPNRDVPASQNGAMADIIAATLVFKMQNSLKPANCAAIDLTLSLLDPLPATNVVELLQLIGTEVAKGDARKSRSKGRAPDIQLCEAAK